MNILRYLIIKVAWLRWVLVSLVLLGGSPGQGIWFSTAYAAATANGELEGRAAPVFRRKCLAGTNAGNLCKQDTECPESNCVDRNVFNISVAVHYDAPAADLTAIQNMVTAGSAVIFDITDGQAEIGQATIHNNAFGTAADLRIYPATCSSGTNVGAVCNVNNDCPPNVAPQGRCGVWWVANTGMWKNGGSMHVSINYINAAARPGQILAHEFTHLVFDARDEYENSPDCLGRTATANCPVPEAVPVGGQECLMDSNGTELCWGQGDSGDLDDLSGGNHDATNVTEQSECRSNRSCWAQVAWSWPSTILMPTGAPDPDANGLVVNPSNFVMSDETQRVVLVLDESGSMDRESPSRMARLKVAAKDFVALAESGTELGIVSYSNDAELASGRANVTIGELTDTNRSTWDDAIDGLSPDLRTNIGAGLQKAKDMIIAAGGVTANTYVVLMTDGLNNEPSPPATAAADLQAKIDDLLTAGIPVYVTCTGGDLNLYSQCSEIAAGTNGFYVDSADAARLPEAFIDLHEKLAGRESVDSNHSFLIRGKDKTKTVYVDQGSESATFTLSWENPYASGRLLVVDPVGNQHKGERMPMGRFVRVKNPIPGEWQMAVQANNEVESKFVTRAYIRNQTQSVVASTRHKSVLPGEGLYVYAMPRSLGGAVSHKTQKMVAQVIRPDGSKDTLELHDQGRDAKGEGDDLPDDGIFTGVYTKTDLKGAYTFLLKAEIDKWHQATDREIVDTGYQSPRFVRELRLSGAVGDPNDVETDPEDDQVGKPPADNCQFWLMVMIIIALLLLLLCIYIYLRCCVKKRG